MGERQRLSEEEQCRTEVNLGHYLRSVGIRHDEHVSNLPERTTKVLLLGRLVDGLQTELSRREAKLQL